MKQLFRGLLLLPTTSPNSTQPVNLQSIYRHLFSAHSMSHTTRSTDQRRILLFLTSNPKMLFLNDSDLQQMQLESTTLAVLNFVNETDVILPVMPSLVWNISSTKPKIPEITEGACSGSHVMDDQSEKVIQILENETQTFEFDTQFSYIAISLMKGKIDVVEYPVLLRARSSRTSTCLSMSKQGVTSLDENADDKRDSDTLGIDTKQDGSTIVRLSSTVSKSHHVILMVSGRAACSRFSIKAIRLEEMRADKDNVSSIVFACSTLTAVTCFIVLVIFICSQCHHALKNNCALKSRSSSDCEAGTGDSIYCSRKISNSSGKVLLDDDDSKTITKCCVIMTMIPCLSYLMLLLRGQHLVTCKKYRQHRFWFDAQCNKLISLLIFLIANVLAMRQESNNTRCIATQAAGEYFATTALLWILIEVWHLHGGFRGPLVKHFNMKGLAYVTGWGIPLPLLIVSTMLTFENNHEQRYCWRSFGNWNCWIFGSLQIVLILITTVLCFLVVRTKTVLKDCKHPSKVPRCNTKIVSSAVFYASFVALGVATELTSLSRYKRFFAIVVIVANLALAVAVIFIYAVVLPEMKEMVIAILELLGFRCQQTNNNSSMLEENKRFQDCRDDDPCDDNPCTIDAVDFSALEEELRRPSLNRHKSLSSGDIPWTLREIRPLGEPCIKEWDENRYKEE